MTSFLSFNPVLTLSILLLTAPSCLGMDGSDEDMELSYYGAMGTSYSHQGPTGQPSPPLKEVIRAEPEKKEISEVYMVDAEAVRDAHNRYIKQMKLFDTSKATPEDVQRAFDPMGYSYWGQGYVDFPTVSLDLYEKLTPPRPLVQDKPTPLSEIEDNGYGMSF